MKIILAIIVLLMAGAAHADSIWTVTYTPISQSSPAPSPSFSNATMINSGILAGDWEFSFSVDQGQTYEVFSPASDASSIYFCAGCFAGSDNFIPGAIGMAMFYQAGSSPLGDEILLTVDNEFAGAYDYYTFGSLTIADPPSDPTPTPEPSTIVLTIFGIIMLILVDTISSRGRLRRTR